MERRLAAILLTDMVGFSRLTVLDEEGTISRQKAHRDEVFDPKISEYGGRIVKTTGDGLLVEFASIVDAVKCAIEVQQAITESEASVPDERRIQYRIGVNLGDIIIDEGDILGDGVNIAARLEALAQPGGICASRTVFNHVKNKLDVNFEDMGQQELKNIPEPMHAYRIVLDQKDANPIDVEAAQQHGDDRSSIAVLPFANMSGHPEQEYFADGIAEDIITALSNVRTFAVLARNTTFAYKGKSVDARQIGRDLKVNYLIEGSVRRAGDRVRVTAQLIDTRTGDHLWAERYDGTLDDIFDVQDRITSTIVGTIEPELVRAEGLRLLGKQPDNLGAYDYLLRGLAYMHKVTPEDTKRGLNCFKKAIDLDPNYGRAYAFASWCYRREVEQHGLASITEADREEAIRLARKALQCDRNDPFVLSYAAATLHQIEADYDEALALMHLAISMHPNSHRFWNGKALLHAAKGETEKAIEAGERAISLGPNDPAIWNSYLSIAQAHLQELRFDEAEDFAKRALRHNENLGPAFYILAAALAQRGHEKEARAALSRALKINPDMTVQAFPKNYQVKQYRNLDAYLDGLRKAGLLD
ncbi:MAG: adenylate/guanylate cyclase domain-containing protein [Hyphomicrobiaceae bacterium]